MPIPSDDHFAQPSPADVIEQVSGMSAKVGDGEQGHTPPRVEATLTDDARPAEPSGGLPVAGADAATSDSPPLSSPSTVAVGNETFGANKSFPANSSTKPEQTLSSDDLPRLDGLRRRPALPLTQVPPEYYEVLGEVGRGGIGVVHRARDLRTDREVALKELQWETVTARERFEREMRITAKLQHPGVVPLYECGRWPDGAPFYAMKLVDGRSLKALIAEAPLLQGRLALLPHVIAVAETIAYAHSRGIIHRDLKPSNIIVGAFGETVVIDWGLAKDIRAPHSERHPDSPYRNFEDATTTSTGAVIGTPAYMPPEQARGTGADERSDVYSLGAVLYHLVAGQPPILGPNSANVLRRLLEEAPRPVREAQPEVPQELATIISKALETDPARRYQSAQEFVNDLKRFASGQLVQAHPYTRAELARRWISRHRVVLIATLATLVVLMGTGIVSITRIVRERQIADVERRAALEQRASARQAQRQSEERANALLLTHARSALDSDPTASLAWLKRYPLEASDWSAARNIVLDAVARGVSRHVLRASRGIVHTALFTSGGTRLVTAGDDRTIRLWDVETGSIMATAPTGTTIYTLAISQDDRFIAVAGSNTVAVFDGHLNPLQTFGHLDATVLDVEFSPDGRWLAAAGGETGEVLIWDTATWQATKLIGHRGFVRAIAFSTHSDQLASGSDDGEVRAWSHPWRRSSIVHRHRGQVFDIKFNGSSAILASADSSGEVVTVSLRNGHVATLAASGPRVRAITFAADDEWLVTGNDDGQVAAWHLADNRQLTSRQHGEVYALKPYPRTPMVASAGLDGALYLLDLRNGETRKYMGHQSAVYSLSVSPDEKYVASAGQDRTARIWEIQAERSKTVISHSDDVYHVVFSPDGRFLATDSRDKTVGLVDLETGMATRLEGHANLVFSVAFMPAGDSLVSAGWDGHINLWDVRSKKRRPIARVPGIIWTLAPSPDGRYLVSGDSLGQVRRWTLDGQGELLGQHGSDVWSVAYSSTGNWLASASADGTILLWNGDSVSPRKLTGHTGMVIAVRFLSDDALVSASYDGSVRVWNTRTGESRTIMQHATEVEALAVSRDSRWVASGADDGLILVHDMQAHDNVRLAGHDAKVRTLAFTPNGDRLISGAQDSTVRVWSMADMHVVTILRYHAAMVTAVSAAPVGDICASASIDRTVRTFPCSYVDAPQNNPGAIREYLEKLTTDQGDASVLSAP